MHGAELTVPARLPIAGAVLSPILARARLLIAAGSYPASEAARVLAHPHRNTAHPSTPGALTRGPEIVVVPPGVDINRYRPATSDERRATRARLGIAETAPLIVSMSRLVPRKGMDVLIAAAALLQPTHPDLMVLIAGDGRDSDRLDRLISAARAPVQLLGRVADADLPGLLGAADVFAMLCRSRWAGLEQEGFGIVFLEAAACGVAQVAGNSGGAAEATEHGETGFVVETPDDPVAAADALARLLDDHELRARMGAASRARVVERFSYDRLAGVLGMAIDAATAHVRGERR